MILSISFGGLMLFEITKEAIIIIESMTYTELGN